MDTETLVKLLNLVALIAVMFAIGLKVKFKEVLRAARQVRLVTIGLMANFVAAPLITVVLLYLFQAAPSVSAGFLILATCPGAPMGPSFTAITKGDIGLATGLMVILAGSSALVAPALLTVFMAWLFPAGEMHFDYLAIARVLLITQLLPLSFGLGIHRWAARFADKAVKPVTLLANILLLTVVVLIVVTQYPTLAAIRLRGWFGMVLSLVACLGVGWLGGGRNRAAQAALAVTTGLRNAAVGLVIVTANFAGTPAVTAVVAYALVTIFGTLLFSFALAKSKIAPRLTFSV